VHVKSTQKDTDIENNELTQADNYLFANNVCIISKKNSNIYFWFTSYFVISESKNNGHNRL